MTTQPGAPTRQGLHIAQALGLEALLGSSSIWTASQRFNTDVLLTFGTTNGTDWDFKHNGSDMYLQSNTGGLMIGLAASPPAPDNDNIHIWKGTAGSVVAGTDSLLVIEDNADAYIGFLTPNGNAAGLHFGDPEDSNAGRFYYAHATNMFQVFTAGVHRLNHSAGAFAFQEATTISTSSGDLTLAPATDIIFKQGGNEIGRFEPAYGGYADVLRVVGITADYQTAIHIQGLAGMDSNLVFYEAGAWKYYLGYDATASLFRLHTTDYNGSSGNRDVLRVADGQAQVDFDVTIGSFDDYDDVAVLEAAYSPTAAAYDLGGGILKQGTELLADIGVLKRYKDGWLGYNPQRMDALIAGGIYQNRGRIKTLEDRIAALEKGT
jgi:hypothetical protein